MPRLQARPRPHRGARGFPIALVLFTATVLTGCMTWKTRDVAPVEALRKPVPRTLRVTLVDGETRDLQSARIEADSLIGDARATSPRWRRDGSGAQVAVAGQPAGRTAFPLSQVVRTEAPGVHAAKTAAVVVPTVGVLGLAFLVWVGSGLE